MLPVECVWLGLENKCVIAVTLKKQKVLISVRLLKHPLVVSEVHQYNNCVL